MWLRRIRRGEGADGNEKKGMRFRRRWRRRRRQSPKTFGGKRDHHVDEDVVDTLLTKQSTNLTEVVER